MSDKTSMTNKFVVQINSHKQSTIVNGKADTEVPRSRGYQFI
jgi:hypothetical protein